MAPVGDPDPGTTTPGVEDVPTSALVVSCETLDAVLDDTLDTCAPGEVQVLAAPGQIPGEALPAGAYRVTGDDGRPVPGATVSVPSGPAAPEMDPVLRNLLQGTLRLPADTAAPADAVAGPVLITTDGQQQTFEAVRAVLATMPGPHDSAYTAVTAAEQPHLAGQQAETYRSATVAGLAVVILEGGLVLAVSLADGLRERIPAHAAMLAAGVPVGVLRRSLLLQLSIPLVGTVALATAVAVLCGAMYQRLDGSVAAGLPWSVHLTVASAALVASLLATLSVLPFLRAARRPESLRTI